MRLSVGSLVKGSITAVSGSGMTSMSLDSIDCHPRIEEPSKPSPSSKADSSLNSEMGTVKCCHCPSRSMNLISTMTAPFSFINANTCFGVIEPVILLANLGDGDPSLRDYFWTQTILVRKKPGREHSASRKRIAHTPIGPSVFLSRN